MPKQHKQKGSIRAVVAVTTFAACAWGLIASSKPGFQASYVVFGYNDLGMHCMNQEFQDLCVLPPANTLHAQVIRRGEEPEILDEDVIVTYSIPGNTTSVPKTNFWQHAQALFGVSLPDDVGLFGYGLSGTMERTGTGDFFAPAIPNTPLTDAMVLDAYQLALVEARVNGQTVASAQPVVPVSWEMRCDSCHSGTVATKNGQRNTSVSKNILIRHDKLHGTDLMNTRPVLCASCHADPALGAPGKPGVSMLSTAMHGSHADRMGKTRMVNKCYACHPGAQTQCLRGVHFDRGMTCTDCHDGMVALGQPGRTPWVDEPKCGSCHQRQGFQFEETGKLFRDSRGHGGVKCEACHGSPHAIAPSVNARDNVQAIALQGYAGTINKCTVCHTQQPEEVFFHKIND